MYLIVSTRASRKYQHQPPFPFALGSEYAGKIASNSPIPKGCPYKPGDRVFGYVQGAYAERVAASWHVMLPLPDNMSYDEGAGKYNTTSQRLALSWFCTLEGLNITWPTSYEALVGRAELKSGKSPG